LEELEKKLDELEKKVDAIGGSVTAILEALVDKNKMIQLRKTMKGVQQICENTNNSLN